MHKEVVTKASLTILTPHICSCEDNISPALSLAALFKAHCSRHRVHLKTSRRTEEDLCHRLSCCSVTLPTRLTWCHSLMAWLSRWDKETERTKESRVDNCVSQISSAWSVEMWTGQVRRRTVRPQRWLVRMMIKTLGWKDCATFHKTWKIKWRSKIAKHTQKIMGLIERYKDYDAYRINKTKSLPPCCTYRGQYATTCSLALNTEYSWGWQCCH